jgi:hypothetical protein
MKQFSRILSLFRETPSDLAKFMELSDAPLGQLTLDGSDLAMMIATERSPAVLKLTVARAHQANDLKWAIAAGKRLCHVESNDNNRLEYVRDLYWSGQIDKAVAEFASVSSTGVGETRFQHTAFLLEVADHRFKEAQSRLAFLDAEMPDQAIRFSVEYVRRLIGAGQFVDARAGLESAQARFPSSFELARLDIRLTMILSGVVAATQRLSTYVEIAPPDSVAFRTTSVELLVERGRYLEAFELLAGWTRDGPYRADYFSLLELTAGHCDRSSDYVALLDCAVKRHPKRHDLVVRRCHAAIDLNDWDYANELSPGIRRQDEWGYQLTKLTSAIQNPVANDPLMRFEAIASDGLAFAGPRIMLALFYYYYHATPETVERARATLEPYLRDHRADSGFLAIYLRLLIALDRDSEAQALFLGMPAGLAATASLAPFGMYFSARAGKDAAASVGWRDYMVETAHMATNARSSYPDSIKFRYKKSRGDVLLFLTVFNGAEFIDWFLKYYRDLGVNHFFIVDNGSTDGTFERLQKETDVSLFFNDGSFSQSACGVFWSNHLMRKYGVGHWCFHVDMDEAFVFPGMNEGRSLAGLLEYMDDQGYGSIPSVMLDIYPESLLTEASADPFAQSCFIDTDYRFVRNELPPYTFIQGGIRARMSGRSLLMTKAPLVKMTQDLAYIANNHQHTHLPIADISSALLHYKFIGNFSGRVDEAILRNEHFMGARFYRALRSALQENETNAQRRLTSEFSVKYTGSEQLQALGLLNSSNNWEKFDKRDDC